MTMAGTVDYNGKKCSLSTLGIVTTDYKEKGQLHIEGDADDESTIRIFLDRRHQFIFLTRRRFIIRIPLDMELSLLLITVPCEFNPQE